MNPSTILFYHYFFLLVGFLSGNLWGSFFSSFCLPPFFFVIGILIGLEIMSYIYYKNVSSKKSLKQNNLLSKKIQKNLIWHKRRSNPITIIPNVVKPLYLLKVGIIFGLFVDAFKVGS